MHYLTLIVGGLVLITAGVLYQQRKPFLDREINGEVTLSSEWLEIVPEPSLKPERDVQMIVLSLEQPYTGDLKDNGVRLPDGSLVLPEVQLVDKNGNTISLKYGGLRGRMNIYYSNFDQLPKDREYRLVRIRSEKPIRCKNIFWSSYYREDIH